MTDHSGSDTEIIRRVIDGDVNAFELLLKKYKQDVFNIVGRRVPYHHIADTAQEVFIRAYQSLPSFKAVGSFRHWLAGVAVRTCCDFWRKAYKSKEFSLSSLTESQEKFLEKIISERSAQTFREGRSRKEAEDLLNYAWTDCRLRTERSWNWSVWKDIRKKKPRTFWDGAWQM